MCAHATNDISIYAQRYKSLQFLGYLDGEEVKFAGYIINSEGTNPDPEHVAAIGEFSELKNLIDLRSFMGLANQFTLALHQT